jgi:hypothetical protein
MANILRLAHRRSSLPALIVGVDVLSFSRLLLRMSQVNDSQLVVSSLEKAASQQAVVRIFRPL